MAQTGAVASHFGLDNQGIRTGGTEFWNLSVPELYEQALQRNEARLAHGGPLVAVTGEHTGRSPDDKFIVRDAETEDAVDWGAVNKPIDRAAFDRLRDRIADYLSSRDLFVQDCFAGADPDYRLRVRVITECAWHSLFARNMFIRPPADALRGFEPEFTVLQAPSVLADPEADGTNSSTFILVDFSQRIIVIGGSEYAGEIKKSVFSILNYLLPKRNVLPMHCSANIPASAAMSRSSSACRAPARRRCRPIRRAR